MPTLNHQPRYRYISLIIITPFLLFWRWTLKGEVLFWGTPLFQFWPWHQLVKNMVLAGEWPLWNPLLGNGTPLLANLQTALFYPPNLIYLLLPVAHALTLSVILHLILAGWLMYVYARHIDLDPFPATVSALAYMFSGYLVGRTQFVTMVNTLAWFPLLLQLSERLATRRVKRDMVWLGLSLAIQILAGHAQLWFYGLWLIGIYTLVRIWQTSHQTGQSVLPNLLRGGVWLGVALSLALLLAAVQLLPTAEFISQSPRSSGAARHFALSYSFWPWRLLTLLLPDFFGNPAPGNYWGYGNYWEDHAYLGVLPFLFALTALWGAYRSFWLPSPIPAETRPQQIARFFAWLIPLSLILAMGWNTPVYLWVFDTIPGFAYFQAPSRLLIWYTLGMAVLAGVGATSFQVRPPQHRAWQRGLMACLGLTIAGFIGRVTLSGINLTFLTATMMTGLLLTLALSLLLTQPAKPFSPKSATFWTPGRWQTATLLFISIDLLWAAWPLQPTLPSTLFTRPIATAELIHKQARREAGRFFIDDKLNDALKFGQYFQFKQFGPTEGAYWQRFRETLVPNLGVSADLPSTNNDDPLVVGRWKQVVDLIAPATPTQRARLLALLNVAYFIDTPAQAMWPTLYKDSHIAIQHVPDPQPRAYFVAQAYPVYSQNEAVDRLLAADFDSRREVIIMDPEHQLSRRSGTSTPQLEEDFAFNQGKQQVIITQAGPNYVHLRVAAPVDGYVVLTDTFYPGWQATLDGQPVTIWLANLAFRAVAVERGQHELIFRYQPRSFYIGLGVSGLTLLTIIIFVIVHVSSNSHFTKKCRGEAGRNGS